MINSLAPPLTKLFNELMHVGEVPSIWKTANVTPIFKNGSSSNPRNYRPISLTCVCGKLFESGIKLVLNYYLHRHGFISDSQHGFLQGRSTTSNLLQSLYDWTVNMDEKNDTLIAYIDFAKAFDRVSIPKFLYKLIRLELLAACSSVSVLFLVTGSSV